jgi:predicted nucleic acid-binding protein
MIVVDASVLALALLNEQRIGDAARDALTADDRWVMPEHWIVELMSVIRGQLLGGKIGAVEAGDAVDAVAEIEPEVPATRVLIPRIWSLRGNLTAYDAAYVAAAEKYGCALVTADRKLARASGIECAVELVE